LPAAVSAAAEPEPPERRSGHASVAEPVERARSILRASVACVLVLAPLPFGAVEPWAVLSLELSAAVCGALALVVASFDRDPLPRGGRWAIAAAVAIAAAAVIQIVPLPEAVAGLLGPSAAALRADVARATAVPAGLSRIAVDPPAALDALLRYAAYVLLGWAAATSVRRPRHVRQLLFALALAGGFQAVYGSMEYLSGRQHIFGYAKVHYSDEASGTFINRNHFAAYLAMVLPAALALAMDAARRTDAGRRVRERLLALASREGRDLAAGAVLAAAIWIGIVLSYSRSGFAVGLAAVGLLVWGVGGGRVRTWIAVGTLAVPTLFLLAQEVRAPGERFAVAGEELVTLHGRIPVWRATLDAVPAQLPLGAGLGSYEAMYALVRPAGTDGRWRHAHNDWLQALFEGGPLVLAAAALLLAVVVARTLGRDRRESILLAGAGTGVVVLALHGLVDFPARIPAIAATGACLAGLALAPVARPTHVVSRRRERRASDRRPWSSIPGGIP
jgi:O-antigen ligase